jgi:hypothetical protein
LIYRKEKLNTRHHRGKKSLSIIKTVDPLLNPLTKDQIKHIEQKQKLLLDKREENHRKSLVIKKANFRAARSRTLENNEKELTKEAIELDQKQAGIEYLNKSK